MTLIMHPPPNLTQVVELLIKQGADVTLQNDSEEGALDVTSPVIRKAILGEPVSCTVCQQSTERSRMTPENNKVYKVIILCKY